MLARVDLAANIHAYPWNLNTDFRSRTARSPDTNQEEVPPGSTSTQRK